MTSLCISTALMEKVATYLTQLNPRIWMDWSETCRSKWPYNDCLLKDPEHAFCTSHHECCYLLCCSKAEHSKPCLLYLR
jgi:hypothetical protein